jgi:hypothetical protein
LSQAGKHAALSINPSGLQTLRGAAFMPLQEPSFKALGRSLPAVFAGREAA